MRKLTKRLLWGLALIFAFVIIWQKVHIVVVVRATFWQLLLLFLGLALGIYLVIEVLFGDSGPSSRGDADYD
jgi:hypothetical protein